MTPGDVFKQSRSRISAKRLKLLLLPSVCWRPNWEAFVPGQIPDPQELWRILDRDHGIEVTLIDPTGFPLNPLAGRHQVFAGLDPARALSILTCHRDADLVLACFEPGAVALLALRRLAAFRAKIALIDIGLNETWAFRRRLLDFVVPRVDAIYPLGQNQVEYIGRRWRTGADLHLIRQHVDTDFYQPADFVDNGPVLSVGDDHGRDFATLLQAFEGIPSELVLRTGRVSADRLPSNARLIGDRLSALEFKDLFRRACIVVVPLAEMLTASGVGTVLEAMAMGKPLIISDSPGIRDYFVPDQTALVVPCGDVSAMRSAIQRLLNEPETRRRLGIAAREFVMRHCTYQAHMNELGPALRRLADTKEQ